MRLDLTEERVRFDFPNAKRLFKFDERDPLSPSYHGAPMKGVDVVAEFPDFQLWIEIKEYKPEEIREIVAEGDLKKDGKQHLKTYLVNNFKYKFRDTYLYRYCENKLTLPIFYVCFTNFDNALNGFFKKELQKQLPTGKPNKQRWKRELIGRERVIVVDEKAWERNLEHKFGTCKRY